MAEDEIEEGEYCPACGKRTEPMEHFTLALSRPVGTIKCKRCGYTGLPIIFEKVGKEKKGSK